MEHRHALFVGHQSPIRTGLPICVSHRLTSPVLPECVQIEGDRVDALAIACLKNELVTRLAIRMASAFVDHSVEDAGMAILIRSRIVDRRDRGHVFEGSGTKLRGPLASHGTRVWNQNELSAAKHEFTRRLRELTVGADHDADVDEPALSVEPNDLKGFPGRQGFLHTPVTGVNLRVAENILTMPVDEQGGVPRGTRPPLQKSRNNRQIEVGRRFSECAHPWIVKGDCPLLPPRPSNLVIRATCVTDLPHLWQDRDVGPLLGSPGTRGQSLFEVGPRIATGGALAESQT